jgi:predicted ATPase
MSIQISMYLPYTKIRRWFIKEEGFYNYQSRNSDELRIKKILNKNDFKKILISF